MKLPAQCVAVMLPSCCRERGANEGADGHSKERLGLVMDRLLQWFRDKTASRLGF